MPSQLFTQYFLTDGVKATPEWKASVDNPVDFESFKVAVAALISSFSDFNEPNEAVTEQQLIIPILEALGWNYYLPQQGLQRNEDIPDHVLFPDAAAKETAASRSSSQARYLDALLIEESKRFGLRLDDREVMGRSRESLNNRTSAGFKLTGLFCGNVPPPMVRHRDIGGLVPAPPGVSSRS